MQTIYAPDAIPATKSPKVFLAGSIEMGKAEDWQAKVIKSLADVDVTILNPRRLDWDSSWKQDPQTEPFRTQVLWEQHGLMFADLLFFNFCAGTQSPVTLLELGSALGERRGSTIVCCPKEYFRYGNVAITCELRRAPVHTELDSAIKHLKEIIALHHFWNKQE